MAGTPMLRTQINGRWELVLPEHRALRPEWRQWVAGDGSPRFGWETERLDDMCTRLEQLYDDMNVSVEPGQAPRRPLIIDVGVEEGDLTALYAMWGCDVVMIEPNPRVWPNVRAIWQANDLRPPLAWYVGFAAEAEQTGSDGEFAWHAAHMTDGWPMCAHGPVIGDHAFSHLAEHPHIPCTTIDVLTATRTSGRNVDAITIDVEGSELRVLMGAENVLRVCRPLVWVSVHTDDVYMDEHYPRQSLPELTAWMGERGYQGHEIAFDHERHWLFEPIESVI